MGEGGSPSVLNREGEKQHNGHSFFLCLMITKEKEQKKKKGIPVRITGKHLTIVMSVPLK